jgi:ribosomal protein L37AE/L43A
MESWLAMTPQERMSEVGDEPDCPLCGKPRVARSTYIRCHPCGKNWVNGVDIFKHPHIKATVSATPAEDAGAQTVKSS